MICNISEVIFKQFYYQEIKKKLFNDFILLNMCHWNSLFLSVVTKNSKNQFKNLLDILILSNHFEKNEEMLK